MIRVQHAPSIVPSAPAIDAIVPVPQTNINLNHSSTSQHETPIVNQSFSLVHNVQEEYQPIGFVFTNHLNHSQSSSRQPETRKFSPNILLIKIKSISNPHCHFCRIFSLFFSVNFHIIEI